MMQHLGVNGPLHFPEDCVLLADKIYPNRHPTITAFTTQQINRKPEHMKGKSRKFNRLVSEYSIIVEHVIGDLKSYKVLGTLWRHPRPNLVDIFETCTALVNRRRTIFDKTRVQRLLVFFIIFYH